MTAESYVAARLDDMDVICLSGGQPQSEVVTWPRNGGESAGGGGTGQKGK